MGLLYICLSAMLQWLYSRHVRARRAAVAAARELQGGGQRGGAGPSVFNQPAVPAGGRVIMVPAPASGSVTQPLLVPGGSVHDVV